MLTFVSPLQAQEEIEDSSKILSEFRSQIDLYRTIVHEPPFQTTSSDAAILKYETGLSLFQNGDGYTAIQTFKDLLGSQKSPDFLKKEIHATLGYIFLEQKRPQEGLKEFSAIEDEIDFKEKARFGIAWSFMEMEEYVKAIALFEEVAAEFPTGEYAPESLFRIGFCYSKLLAFKSAAESYQKALHVYNQRIQDQNNFIKTLRDSLPFNSDFIFNSPDPRWAGFLIHLKGEANGRQMMKGALDFLKMEERLKQRDPDLNQHSLEVRQNLLQIRNKINLLFQNFVQEQLHEQKKSLENLSVQASIAMAKNRVLEKSEPGRAGVFP